MNLQVNYSQLRHIELDIQNLKRSPALSLFMSDKIRSFYTRNAMRLNVMNDRMQYFIKKYVLHDADDKPLTKPGENGNESYQFLNEENEKEYLKAVKDFMEIFFEIES